MGIMRKFWSITIRYLGYLIEEKKAIRRFIVLTCYPAWLFLSVVIVFDFIRNGKFDMSFATFYATFTSVVTIVVGFYFYGRSKEKDGKGIVSRVIQKINEVSSSDEKSF